MVGSEDAAAATASSEGDQSDVIAFLEDSATHGGVRPARFDTHLSHVFLTDTDVYKLKRATRFDFVDYSTPARRQVFCEREIDANRFWSRTLYKGVLPIRRTAAGFTLGGQTGDPVDWLVHMRRFPDRARLDRRLSAGEVKTNELVQFADDLARLHTTAAPNIGFGGATAMTKLIDQIAGGLERAVDRDELAVFIKGWRRSLSDQARKVSNKLDDRRRTGKIRRCHGDLHLKNIVVWDDALIGFDALEFDDAMCTIDVLYDLAFPVMDFIHANRPDAANLVLNRYLARTSDYTGLAVFDLYLSLRAGVRALASVLGGDASAGRAYLDTASLFDAWRPKPRLIAIGGRSGSGKSTVASAAAGSLGRPPGAIVLRSDVIRKVINGLPPEKALGDVAYRPAKTADVYQRMRCMAATVIDAGYDCILDATFLDAGERKHVDRLAKEVGVGVHKLWLDAPADTLRTRIASRGEDASDADQAVLEQQLAITAPRTWHRVDASGDIAMTVRGTLDAILEPHPNAFIPKVHNPAHDV